MGLSKSDIFSPIEVQDVLAEFDDRNGMIVPTPAKVLADPLTETLLATDNLDGPSAAVITALVMMRGKDRAEAKNLISYLDPAIAGETWQFRAHFSEENAGKIIGGLVDLDTPTATRLAIAVYTNWGSGPAYDRAVKNLSQSQMADYAGEVAHQGLKLLTALAKDGAKDMSPQALARFGDAVRNIAGWDAVKEDKERAETLLVQLFKKQGRNNDTAPKPAGKSFDL